MTFEECVKNFPLRDTLIGSYSTEQSFTLSQPEGVYDIADWRDSPFWEDESCYSFIVYCPESNKFECWSFLFDRVCGYINESEDVNNFYPATCTDSFGWSKIDPLDPRLEDQITLPDIELAKEKGWPLEDIRERKWRREQVAYLFDREAYNKGYIFTSHKAIIDFVESRNHF